MASISYCAVAIAPVRAAASDKAEIVTQLLFGELVEVVDSEQQWLQIRTFMDNYEGWIDGKQVRPLTQKEVNRWLDGLTIESSLTRKLETPWGNQVITRGAFVPFGAVERFSIGNDAFSFLDTPDKSPETIVEFSLRYVNTPYLWGGKTPFGIDCSGLMQTIHRYFGINLPRDASQQVAHGESVDFEERKGGDLVFFQNAEGKVHHVGLLLNPLEVIHASGYVRIDDYTQDGIIRRKDGQLSHLFYAIKRL